MKIYNRQEFMKLPPGTLFRKGKPCYFGNLQIKADSLETDFVCMDIGEWEAQDSGDWSDKFDEMQDGKSIPMTDNFYGRDGEFDYEEVFLVLEKDDLRMLKFMVENAIELQKGV